MAVAFAAVGCATKPPPAPAAPPAAALPPLPRSSIAAVVLKRDELHLTDDQVRQMEEIDRRREQADQALRDEPAHAKKAGTSGGSPPPAGGTGMGGMRGGRMGGMGGMGGRRRSGGVSPSAGERDRPPTAEERMDDNDTRAYLEAEAVLDEEQRPKARDIAERYREALYDRREQLRNAAHK
jgi:hypothetical protein